MCNVTVFQSAVDHIYDDGLIDCNRAEFLGRNENMWYKRNFSSFDGSSICGAWQRFFLTRSTSIFECTKDISNCHWPVSGRGACLLKCCVFRGCSPPHVLLGGLQSYIAINSLLGIQDPVWGQRSIGATLTMMRYHCHLIQKLSW